MTRRGFVRCDRCDGLGSMTLNSVKCSKCNGEGEVQAPPRVDPEYRTLGRRLEP